ncbi:MAG TPA: EF-P lysine aminoacylase EpmA [Steroidobacteraceae bacterium]|jgi:lysyl-tRNA synthetase class 2|nr:EF-P lysine aminoacylase EpmA [Steroidobacteraceae bacterium]
MSWAPSADLAILRLRAELLAAARGFFADRQVLEVDTPALVRHAVTDLHIHSAQVQLPGHGAPLFLHTSPEYAMKRLLAAGSGDIYQIAHVFRGDERGRQHNPEFTLIEWYRCGYSMQQLMQEVAQLAAVLLGLPPASPFEALSYQQAFQRQLDCAPLTATDAALRTLAMAAQLDRRLAEDCSRDELLDWLMGSAVGPRLGTDRLCFVHSYPASQAALARLDASDPRVALRFELYYHGLELANGFEELADAGEQRARFEAEREQRRRRGLPAPDIDQALLQALAAGLPPVSGVALGFDRLLMLRSGASDISEVLAFALERA